MPATRRTRTAHRRASSCRARRSPRSRRPRRASTWPAIQAAVDYAGKRNTARAGHRPRRAHRVREVLGRHHARYARATCPDFAPVLSALLVGVGDERRADRSTSMRRSVDTYRWADDPRGAISLRQLLTRSSGFAKPGGWPWPGTRARDASSADLRPALLAWRSMLRSRVIASQLNADILALQRAAVEAVGQTTGELSSGADRRRRVLAGDAARGGLLRARPARRLDAHRRIARQRRGVRRKPVHAAALRQPHAEADAQGFAVGFCTRRRRHVRRRAMWRGSDGGQVSDSGWCRRCAS